MNIRASDITNTSFLVQWDEVDDANQYIINWRAKGDNVEKTHLTPNTSHTIRGLTPNTNYNVTVNVCGNVTIDNSLLVTTNMTTPTNLTILVTPSKPLSISSTASTNMYNPTTMTSPTGM